jgi:very-short-patch-repair endonuclease
MAMRAGKLYRGTPAELALEDAVAALGVPYRFQFPGYLYGLRYFPDFYLPTLDLILEVDDPSHFRGDKPEKDDERTADLSETWGCTVVRCTNEEALSDPHGAVQRMIAASGKWPPSPSRRLAASLPVPKKAPQRERRAAKSAALRRARSARNAESTRRPGRPRLPHAERRTA